MELTILTHFGKIKQVSPQLDPLLQVTNYISEDTITETKLDIVFGVDLYGVEHIAEHANTFFSIVDTKKYNDVIVIEEANTMISKFIIKPE